MEVVGHALQHGGDALEPRAGVHARLGQRHERAVGPVAAVGEGLPHRADPRGRRDGEHRRAGQAQDGQRVLAGVVGVPQHGVHHPGGLVLVADDAVVEGAVRLDVAHPRAAAPRRHVQLHQLEVHEVGHRVP